MENGEMKPDQVTSLVEAISEVKRELNMRIQCFGRWVDQGRLSEVDAKCRMNRLGTALKFLLQLHAEEPDARVPNFGDMTGHDNTD